MATNQSDNIDLLKQQLYLEVGTSNRVLSDQEEHLVRAMLFQSLQTMDRLNSGILRFQSLCKMEVERIERYQQALSPHKKVPPELLTEIFSHCIEERPIACKPHDMNDMPWVLLRVCSRWREVVKQAPFLTFQTRQYDYRWRTTHSIFSTFHNSKLILQSTPGYGICSGFATNIIMPFSSRITELSLGFPGDRDINFELLPKSPHISFESLQSLSFGCAAPPPAAVFEIMRRSPALIKITLLYEFRTLSIEDLNSCETIAPVILPNLRSIESMLRGGSQMLQSVALGAFMKHIIAPSLRHMSSNDLEWGTVSDIPFPYGVFRSLVSRSSCVLNSLWLDVRSNEEELNQLLRVTPFLRSLYLSERSKVSGLTLDAMADGQLLPQLQNLECHTDIPGALHSMVNLLIKRTSAGSELRGYVDSRINGDEFQANSSIVDGLDPEITTCFKIKLIKWSV